MNPPRQPPPYRGNSRFIRGRARGGGAYRPYFYFRRNGRTIPAGAGGGGNPTKEPKGRKSSKSRAALTESSGIIPPPTLNTSFLRPGFYAAPENGLVVSSISTTSPVQYPGWRLYFPHGEFKAETEMAKRMKAIETHYNNNQEIYDYSDIQNCGYFKLQAQVVSFDSDLLQVWPNLLQDMQSNPEKTLAIFGVVMHSVVTIAVIDASLSLPACNRNVYNARYTRVRKIVARPVGFAMLGLVSMVSKDNIDQLCCIRGCVTAVGTAATSFDWVAYKCSRCGEEQAVKQQGFFPSRPFSCKRSDCHAKNGFVEQRNSPYTQILPLQMIRVSETNLQAKNIDADSPDYLYIELRHENVDSFSPGQEIIITGVVKMSALTEEQQSTGYNSSPIDANSLHIYMQALYIEDAKNIRQHLTERDLKAIAMINAECDSFKLMVQSLAPEVHGQELVKAGVLLSLFGGAGSQVHNDSDINILLVGDPGVGKSTLLQTVSKLSERGTMINGKRQSSALQQLSVSFSGSTKMSIDAGALLSSHTGHCSVDDVDRLASQQEMLLHFMQTQTLTMPFPNLFVSFKTPTTILATANSVRGHYDNSRSITENIRIHPSLLKQFHLLFVMLDKPDKDMDTSLTEHIRAIHAGIKKSTAIVARYELKPKINNSMNGSVNEELNEHYDLEERLKLGMGEEEELDLLPPILLKKFIAYAHQQVKPLLTDEAAEELRNFYMNLRQESDEDKLSSCTISQLEGLIRLAQARSKIDFSSEVTKLHVRDVLCIVRQSMADTALGDYIDRNPATSLGVGGGGSGGSQNNLIKKFLNILQIRSNALGRSIFDFDELKEIARIAGISNGVLNIIEIANLQGFLLKKGPNIYEVMEA